MGSPVLRLAGCRLMGFQLGQKRWNRGTLCVSCAHRGLWGAAGNCCPYPASRTPTAAFFNHHLPAGLSFVIAIRAGPAAGKLCRYIAKNIMLLRPTFLKLMIVVVLFALTLLIVTERKATSKVTWEETRGTPLAFMTLTQYQGPCGSEGGFCTNYSISNTGLATAFRLLKCFA